MKEEKPKNIIQKILCCPRRIRPEQVEDMELDTEKEPSRSMATKKTHAQRVIENRSDKVNSWPY